MSISIFALNTAGWVGYMTPGAGESFWILYQYLHYTVPQKLFFLAKKQWSQKSIAPPGVFTEETRMWEISQNEDRPMPSLSPKSHNILIKRCQGHSILNDILCKSAWLLIKDSQSGGTSPPGGGNQWAAWLVVTYIVKGTVPRRNIKPENYPQGRMVKETTQT